MDTFAEAIITVREAYCTRLGLPITVVKVQPSMTSTFTYATRSRQTAGFRWRLSTLLGRLQAAPAAESGQAAAFDPEVYW